MVHKNSGLVNFAPESRLPFVQISLIYRKTTANLKSNLMAWKKWNANFRLEYFVQKNGTTFSDVPLLPDVLSWNNQKNHVPFTFQLDFSETFVNGKQPLHIPAPVPTQADGSAVNGLCTLSHYLAFLFYLAYFYQKITDQITF